MDKELYKQLSSFLGEFKGFQGQHKEFEGRVTADIKTITKTLDNHSESLKLQNEILQKMAVNELKMSNFFEKQTQIAEDIKDNNEKTQKKITDLENRIGKNEQVVNKIKWAFGIATAILVPVSVFAIRKFLGL